MSLSIESSSETEGERQGLQENSPSSSILMHDPWWTPSSPSLKSLSASLFDLLESRRPKLSRQRQDAKERRKAMVENLAASLALLVRQYPPGSKLALAAENKATTRYDRPAFSREVFMQAIRGMEETLPKTERHLLQVNGEPIADLDFAGMFVQLAYLMAGLALPNSDPYEDIQGLVRADAKLALSALLCRTGPMKRLPKELAHLARDGWSAERLSAAVAERHPGIAHLFGKGIGLKLMKTESEILLAALGILFEQGIPAMPMHDGIMVPGSGAEAARKAMARASMLVVGVALPVTQKT